MPANRGEHLLYLQKYVTDFQTILNKPEIFDEFKNCIFFLPITCIDRIYSVLENIIKDEKYSDEDKKEFMEKYEKIIRFTNEYSKVLESLPDNKTDNLLYNKENNTYICYTKSIENARIKKNGLTLDLYDVLSTTISESAQFVTIDDNISKIKEKLHLEFFLVKI